MRTTMLLALVTLLFTVISTTECLECYSCTSIRNVSDCHYVTSCHSGEHCFTRVDGHGANALFTLGCRSIQDCSSPGTTQLPSAIVGRDTSVNSNVECDQCCAQSVCNKRMCSKAAQVITSPNSQCQDADEKCETFGSTFNLCGDVLHAKTFCQKWCGLCDLVDGGWASWNQWSACSVTCATGHKSRHRTCTNPSPASGGSDCVGLPTETSTCTLESCPVHGGWAQWSSWGTCSNSCGIGLERRDRSCSKPYPGPDGDPCFGDFRDDRTCFDQACSDGNWSSWSNWGNCSAQCNGGLMERSRTCDNPAPSTFGKSCTGNNVDADICNDHACPDGNWSSWSNWGNCSAKCNGGLMERSRTCDNPAPSTFGKSCLGNDVDTNICNNHACQGPMVYFTVNTPNRNLVSNSRPIFTNTIENVGDGYNTTSAQFVCPVSGLYIFSATFASESTPLIQCYFYHNSTQVAFIRTTSTGYSSFNYASATINVHLNKYDTFELSKCNTSNYWKSYVFQSDSCMFSGALINPSQ